MERDSDKQIWWVFLIIIAFVAIAGFVVAPLKRSLQDHADVSGVELRNEYANETYGVHFHYPQGYTLVQNEAPLESPHLVSLSFFDVVAYQDFLEDTGAREGPPGITLDIYEGGDLAPEAWLEGNNFLGIPEHGAVTSMAVDNASAARFPWSGLYEGESVVIGESPYVYVFTLTYIDREEVQGLFDAILESVSFDSE